MKELQEIREQVRSALEEAGLPAVTAFPDRRAREYPGAVAAVSVGAAQGKNLGFCNYLGEVWDQESGTVRELYGKRLDAEITVEVRGVRAAVCEEGCETAAEVLLGGLPSGIRPGELSWEALTWERESEAFLRRGRLRCEALFVARSSEEADAFLDFTLKGVLTS